MICPDRPPDTGLLLMWCGLTAGVFLAVGKVWGDRTRRIRIMRRRHPPDR